MTDSWQPDEAPDFLPPEDCPQGLYGLPASGSSEGSDFGASSSKSSDRESGWSDDEPLTGEVLDGPSERNSQQSGRNYQQTFFFTTNWGPSYQQPRKQNRPRKKYYGGIQRGRPNAKVTGALVGINALVFLIGIFIYGFAGDWGFHWKLAFYEPWRFLTAAFVHSGPAHLIFNLMALGMVGQYLEPIFGHLKFAIIYLFSAIGGSIGTLLLTFPPGTPGVFNSMGWFTLTVGASGAVFGLFGTLLVVQKQVGESTTGLWILLGINAFYSLAVPNISWQGHLGGFLVGLAAGALTVQGSKNRGKADLSWLYYVVLAAALAGVCAAKYQSLGLL